MSVSILQRCAVSSVQQSSQWVIVVNYKPIKGKSQRATYVASNGYEVRELQSIVSTRKMPSSLIDVLINDLSPIFASGDDPDTVQKKVADALRRGLGGQSGG